MAASFSTFQHGHQDLVLAVDFNLYGDRMVTASSDHRLKVWDKKDENWILTDTWRAHDAEIVDVKWNTPLMGNVLASIAEDGRFRLWEEDVTETPNSGRRFVMIHSQISETKVPYQSLDIKNIDTETYIALITRDGYLTVTAPVEHSDLRNSEWSPLTQEFVCPTPSASEETGFRVSFHKDPFPCPTAVMAGLDRKSLSLAVSAMNTVKIYRTDVHRRFYVAATLTGPRDIIRDVAWANGSARGYDRIATASKDGAIRIYKLTVPAMDTSSGTSPAARNSTDARSDRDGHFSSRHAPSGIGAGLATVRPGDASRAGDDDQYPGRIKQRVEQVAEIAKHGNATWRLSFDHGGSVLLSTGDDGALRLWAQGPDGEWRENSDIQVSKE